ncbi:MAG: hypothetical protein BV457_01425 [Thermoplasmata archaeon M9B1D]|nr:MAG: hypothetical protein BV457_01425 [Thermoplasmata archaeon M9B1D]PNX51316.1 MAG: hypothetical protein BV456_03655 [Thermoplasmata archaeon M8B2D]
MVKREKFIIKVKFTKILKIMEDKYMKTIKKVSITIILFLSLCLSIFSVTADPTIEIETNPANPERLSTFTVIATITGENIISVTVTISECTKKPPAQCFVAHSNIPMTLDDNGKYEAEVTLTGTQDSIDHVQYLFVINDNGTEYQVGDLKTDLKIDDTNNNGGDNGTPGFELIILLSAVFISLLILKRKR